MVLITLTTTQYISMKNEQEIPAINLLTFLKGGWGCQSVSQKPYSIFKCRVELRAS